LGGYYLCAPYKYDQQPTSAAISSLFHEHHTSGSYSLKFNPTQGELKVPLCYWKSTLTVAEEEQQKKHVSPKLENGKKLPWGRLVIQSRRNLGLEAPVIYLSARLA
jgi:hypothetical protein